jgi:hypothetical protein
MLMLGEGILSLLIVDSLEEVERQDARMRQ